MKRVILAVISIGFLRFPATVFFNKEAYYGIL